MILAKPEGGIRVRRTDKYVVGDSDWHSSGDRVTAPKGYRAAVQGRVPNVSGVNGSRAK